MEVFDSSTLATIYKGRCVMSYRVKKIAKQEIRKFANSYYCKKDRAQVIKELQEKV